MVIQQIAAYKANQGIPMGDVVCAAAHKVDAGIRMGDSVSLFHSTDPLIRLRHLKEHMRPPSTLLFAIRQRTPT